MYKIRYEYQTGNSFESEYAEDILELTWNNLEVAKANLVRIKEHYDYYRAMNSYEFRRTDQQKQSIIDAPSNDWYVGNSIYEETCLKLKTDDGRDWQLSAPWCGYFERLHGCTIISDDLGFRV